MDKSPSRRDRRNSRSPVNRDRRRSPGNRDSRDRRRSSVSKDRRRSRSPAPRPSRSRFSEPERKSIETELKVARLDDKEVKLEDDDTVMARDHKSDHRSDRKRDYSGDRRDDHRSGRRDDHRSGRRDDHRSDRRGDYKHEQKYESKQEQKYDPKSEQKADEKVSMPSFEPSGKLAADTNTFKGVVIKYNEPPEAAKPRLRWRLYPMKGEEVMQPFYVHRQSAYLIGRDRKIADFPVDHPSCSKQHAALQYRSMPFERNGAQGRRTLPYIIDLASANGTYLNSERIEPQRYYELKEQDILKFGYSQREYVVLHELSAEGKGGEEVDEDIEAEDPIIDKEGAEEKFVKQEEDYF